MGWVAVLGLFVALMSLVLAYAAFKFSRHKIWLGLDIDGDLAWSADDADYLSDITFRFVVRNSGSGTVQLVRLGIIEAIGPDIHPWQKNPVHLLGALCPELPHRLEGGEAFHADVAVVRHVIKSSPYRGRDEDVSLEDYMSKRVGRKLPRAYVTLGNGQVVFSQQLDVPEQELLDKHLNPYLYR